MCNFNYIIIVDLLDPRGQVRMALATWRAHRAPLGALSKCGRVMHIYDVHHTEASPMGGF